MMAGVVITGMEGMIMDIITGIEVTMDIMVGITGGIMGMGTTAGTMVVDITSKIFFC